MLVVVPAWILDHWVDNSGSLNGRVCAQIAGCRKLLAGMSSLVCPGNSSAETYD